jgi:hypothetical protein
MATPTQLPNGNWSYTNPQGITTVGTQESVNAAANQPVPQPVAPTAQPVAQPAPVTQPTQTAQPAPTTQSTIEAAPATSQTASQTAVQPAVMPSNGSVVDLLNQTGQSSAFAERAALAKQFGIQGYTGSATQNTDLAKKYLDFYNSKQGTAAPNSNPRQEIQDATTGGTPAAPDPEKASFDAYMGMNPVAKSLYDSIQTIKSSQTTQQSYVDLYKQLETERGLPALKTEYMNIKNLMDGTEDSIRTEIAKAGGFATENQVAALAAARNKTWIKQSNELANQINSAEDYIDHIVDMTKADRQEVSDNLYKQLGLTEKVSNMVDKQNTAAKENFQKVVDKVGYKGLADAFQGDVESMKYAEQSLGLPKGSLSNQNFLAATEAVSDKMPASVQEYEYAKKNGYSGTFSQYQDEDANRKRSIAAAGVGGTGLTPAQVNSTVNTIAGAFDNEPIVKAYNTVQEGYQTISNIGVNTKNPSDDIAFIYAFAKIMDPNSVVREGEYNTIQKYAQTWADNFKFKADRIFSNTNFLTADAKQKMLNTLKPKVDTITSQYKNVESEYQRQINDTYAGKPRQITNYAATPTASSATYLGTGPISPALMAKADAKKFDIQGALQVYTLTEISDYLNK